MISILILLSVVTVTKIQILDEEKGWETTSG